MLRNGLTVVPIRDFQGRLPSTRARLVPDRPGIYFFVHDFRPAIKGRHLDRLDQSLVHSRTMAEGKLGLFYHVAIAEEGSRLTNDKREKLMRLSDDQALSDWLCWVCSVVQHPLYVGKASNLRQRLLQHLSAESRLRGYLEEQSVEILDCCFVFAAVPLDVDQGPGLHDGDVIEGYPIDDEELSDDHVDADVEDDEVWQTSRLDLMAVDVAESIVISGSRPIAGKRRG